MKNSLPTKQSQQFSTINTHKSYNGNFNHTNTTTTNMKILQELHFEKKFEQYLSQKFQWNEQTFRTTDWKTLKVYRKPPTIQKIQFIKLSHKRRPTEKKLYQTHYEESNSLECTLCGHPSEDDDHQYKYIYPTVREAQMKSIKELRQNLYHIHTNPILTKPIAKYTKSYMREEQHSNETETHTDKPTSSIP